GQPAELPPPAVVVPGDKSDFELTVAFPFGTAAADLAGVKLVASTDAPLGQSPTRSNEIPVSIKIVPGDAPPPRPALFAVFEDEPTFAGTLIEGDGQIGLERGNRYSGNASLRVTPVQKFRTRIPGWSIKIKEKPGEGEFRYLRFAWRKKGGDSIILQLTSS